MNKTTRNVFWCLMILAACISLMALAMAHAQMDSEHFGMHASVLDEGGGQRSSVHFGTRDAIGQAAGNGIIQSDNFKLYAGFVAGTMREFFPSTEPRIRLSVSALEFGKVNVGNSRDRTLTVYNDGANPLDVTSIAADDLQFVCLPTSATISGHGSREVTVTFTPTAELEISATLTILSNDTSHHEMQVSLHGTGGTGCQGGDIGDVNADASINVLDVLNVVNDILGIIPLDENGKCRADCNGDASINVLDALGIVNVILFIIPECPGAESKIEIRPEAMKFLESLEPYFLPAQFERFMNLVKEVLIPEEYSLVQNYPNPFNPATAINYQIPMTKSQVQTTLKVYNILGQEVATLVDEVKTPGYYTVIWDASDMASGIYFCRLEAGTYSATRRMVLIR